MRLTRRIVIQLVVLAVVATTAFSVMALGYIRLPNLLFGIGHYTVTVQLPEAAGLYKRGNVTYLGTEVGQVKELHLTSNGVDATLSLRSDVKIPSDLDVQVHSVTAVGEQYVALLPRNDSSAPLKNGDLIPVDRASVPPDINMLLDATNRGLLAIPQDNLQTTIDESYTAFSGLGPEISRLVKGSTQFAIDAHNNLGDVTNVIDHVAPVLDSQSDTSRSVRAWAEHLADITRQLKEHDDAVRGTLGTAPEAASEVRNLFDQLQPTLPIVLADLTSVAPVLVTYRADLEQILVLLPMGAQIMQGITVPNRNVKTAYPGGYLDFNLNLNIPPPCTTGFLPVQQQRTANLEDFPDRPAGDLYCRTPQDAMFGVRGVRNLPCETRPGKRAPTVALCESNENYVPLNDGFNWKGDPNATLSGQDIPQLLPGSRPGQAPDLRGPAPAPIAAAAYDPATGIYVGPDGHVYTQSNLSHSADKEQTWQRMLIPPGS